MKKKLIVVFAILVVLITLICIPKSTYQKWFGNEVVNNESPVLKDYLTVFVANSENKIVGVKVYLEKIEEDTIKQKWDLLTSKMNMLPNGYTTTVCPSTVLNNYEIQGDKLVLNVSEEILKSSGRLTIETLAWTFCDENITEIVLKNNDVIVSEINDCKFKSISKEIGVNYVFETAYLYESNFTTMVYYEDDLIVPITYFYKDIVEYDFVMNKIFDYNKIEYIDYEYEVTNEELVISLEKELEINDNLKNSIIETAKLNFDVKSIIVSSEETTILEQTFSKVN